MKPIKVIASPRPAPLPTAQGSFPSCNIHITQEDTYAWKTIFHFDPVPNATDYAAFANYSDPLNANQLAYYPLKSYPAGEPVYPNQIEISATKLPLQNHEYTFDLVAYTATAVICVQRVTFITNYLI